VNPKPQETRTVWEAHKNLPKCFSLAQIWRIYNVKIWSLCTKFWRNSKCF